MRRPLAYVTPWFVAAFVVLGVLWWQQQTYQREACERGNEFRGDDLPAAFAEYSRELGRQFEAPPGRVAEVIDNTDRALARRFPPRDC